MGLLGFALWLGNPTNFVLATNNDPNTQFVSVCVCLSVCLCLSVYLCLCVYRLYYLLQMPTVK